jgi:hypothetical protein
MMQHQIIVEDSIHGFHIIDLSEFAEVKASSDTKSWAGGGCYYEVYVRKHGETEFTMYRVDSERWIRYKACTILGISYEEYDISLKVRALRKERDDFR